MNLQVGDERVGITWGSLMLFLIFTAIGTVIGGVGYAYLQKWLPWLPQQPVNPATP